MRILGLKWLASLLYPNEYAVDLVKETQDFYALFLGVNITRQEAQKVLDQDYS
jgi:iron complex transport system substrate-binding protein